MRIGSRSDWPWAVARDDYRARQGQMGPALELCRGELEPNPVLPQALWAARRVGFQAFVKVAPT